MVRSVPAKTALVGLLFAPGAMAQQPPDQNAQAPDPTPPPTENKPADPTAAPATMQPVTVTGTRPSDDFQVTRGSINRMGAADADGRAAVGGRHQQGADAVAGRHDVGQNALRNVPGVTIGAAEGGTIGNNINLNGFSARTDIYLDGMRDRGQYYRDIFALEQIEVLMGPSSMLFGRGSTGGVINQVTKKPFLKKATELSVQATTNGLVALHGRRQRAVRPGQHQRGPRHRRCSRSARPRRSTRPTCWISASRRRSSSASARRPRSRCRRSCSTARTRYPMACRT